jgi:hypothetical protein
MNPAQNVFPTVLVQRDARVVTLTLDRPGNSNRWRQEMHFAFEPVFARHGVIFAFDLARHLRIEGLTCDYFWQHY